MTAVAIALAESGGDPHAHNTRGEDSRGLWQIYVTVHPEFAGLDLYDPATNARAAFILYQRHGGFQDWTTYTKGRYQAFINVAQQAVIADARGEVYEAEDLPASTSSDLPPGQYPFDAGAAYPQPQPTQNNLPMVLGAAAAAFFGVSKVLEWLEDSF